MRKVLAVVLAVLMVTVILPAYLPLFTDFSIKTSAAVDPTDVGVVRNGDFRIMSDTYIPEWNCQYMETSTKYSNTAFFKPGRAPEGTYLMSQVIPVNQGATYTWCFTTFLQNMDCEKAATFTYRVELGMTETSFEKTVIANGTPVTTGSIAAGGITKYPFNSGEYKFVRIAFIARGSVGSESYVNNIYFDIDDAGDTTTHAIPTLKHTHEGKSRMEMIEDGSTVGLAFLFDLKSKGAVRDNAFVGNLDNATVDAFENGGAYRLICAGAVMTNQESIGTSDKDFVREKVNEDKTLIDINAYYLWSATDGSITYPVRIPNIPATYEDTVIYARPYYVFDHHGTEYTVYGDIQWDSYNGIDTEDEITEVEE